jgi:hypothetical protein
MNQSGQLSGDSYISAIMRIPETDKDRDITKIRLVAEKFCDHTETVCPTKKCVESWEIDWNLLFKRTKGGRRVLERLGREV